MTNLECIWEKESTCVSSRTCVVRVRAVAVILSAVVVVVAVLGSSVVVVVVGACAVSIGVVM